MLRTETVTPGTLELLKELMNDEVLNDFFLVGGTALSLYIGHRMSIDIDLFATCPFNEEEVLIHLSEKGFQLNYQSKNSLKGQINDIQVDLITHGYPFVKPLQTIDGVRLASLEDVAAMKLNAIISNGTRLKYFINITCLSCYLSLTHMIEAYEAKYTHRNPYIILKSLEYTEEVNKSEPIKLLDGVYSWGKLAARLKQMPGHPEKVFQTSPFA